MHRGSIYNLVIKRIAILIMGLFLIFTNNSPRAIFAQEATDEQKDTALEELQKIKENEAVYESQLSELLKKSLAIENQYQLTQKRFQKTLKAAQKAQNEIWQNKILAENMRLQRKRIISELYILTNDPLYFVLSFVNTDEFLNRMHGKDENSIVIGERIKKVVEINELLNDLSERQKVLAIKNKAYSEQAEKLAQVAAQIQAQIAQKESSLSGFAGKRDKLEKYILGLDKISSNLKRDFVSWNSATGPIFEFIGGGTEHGLGLSQYGAKGMADLGKNYRQILSHYYQKTEIGKTKTNPKVRIGIVLGGEGGNLQVLSGNYQIHGLIIRAGFKILVTPSAIRIYNGEKEVKKFAASDLERILPASSNSQIQVDYKSSYFNKYSGEIRIIKKGASLTTVNVLPLEEYLKGVVVAEMPHTWSREAIKAQALAARSYALRHLKTGGSYDMDDSTAYQVYIGSAHRARSDHAVEETRGEVVTYAGKIIPTYYFSTSGGWTENNENIWGGRALPFLRGVESAWEEDSPWWTWYTKKYSRSQISALLSSLSCGRIKKIAIVNRGISGRVLAIKIIGSQGVRVISGAHFKDLINAPLGPEDEMMRSTLFGIK